MKDVLISLYRFLFARPALYNLNLHLYKLSLRGLGVLNAEGPEVTGEKWLQLQLARDLTPRVIVDVGANLDVYGADAFPDAQIFACEPHPDTFTKLKKLYSQDTKRGRVKLLNLAISSKPGTLTLYDFADDATMKHTQPTSTLASLSKDVIESLHQQKAKSYSVGSETIDRIVQKYKIAEIDILKIDTEGHEYQVLLGAEQTLKQQKIKLIQFEFNEMNVHTKSFFLNFMQLLPEFEFYRLLPYGVAQLGEYRPLTHEIFGFQNIICVRKDLVSRFAFLRQH